MNAAVDSKVFKANRLKAGLDPKHMPEHIAVIILAGAGRCRRTRPRGPIASRRAPADSSQFCPREEFV